MIIIVALIVISIILAIGFLIAFIFFVKNGEMDDTYTPSVRILLDDFKPEQGDETQQNNTSDKSQGGS